MGKHALWKMTTVSLSLALIIMRVRKKNLFFLSLRMWRPTRLASTVQIFLSLRDFQRHFIRAGLIISYTDENPSFRGQNFIV